MNFYLLLCFLASTWLQLPNMSNNFFFISSPLLCLPIYPLILVDCKIFWNDYLKTFKYTYLITILLDLSILKTSSFQLYRFLYYLWLFLLLFQTLSFILFQVFQVIYILLCNYIPTHTHFCFSLNLSMNQIKFCHTCTIYFFIDWSLPFRII